MPPQNQQNSNNAFLKQLVIAMVTGSWFELLVESLKLGKRLFRGMVDEGLYEVLEYETTLELKDKKGEKAKFYKRQKVQYLQDNIIAYQDQAWGDGDILLDYKCSPGVQADTYRIGHVNYVLISLREQKNKGDSDEFHIEWGMKDAFLEPFQQWGTEISHKTKYFKTQIIFPKSRKPTKAWILEHMSQKRTQIEEITELANGRWSIAWESHRPRLHENYIIGWEW